MNKSASNEAARSGETSFKHRSARVWLKIIIRVDSRMSEAVAAFLADLTGSGIEITSENNTAESPPAMFTEKLTGYIPLDLSKEASQSDSIMNDIEGFLSGLSHIFPDCSPPGLSSEIIKEEDWGKVWKSFFSSFRITPNLIIKPSWEKAGQQLQDANKKNYVIEMDPGLAFGTGHHASTQLALTLIEELFLNRKYRFNTVLDLGTGSGILAMACALFGAKKVLAIDNDPDAAETAKGNISRNQLDNSVTVSGQDVFSLNPGYSLIVANITRDILAEMSECLTRLLDDQGFLILSGILKGEQENSIRDIYKENGFCLNKSLIKDEWAALLFHKDT